MKRSQEIVQVVGINISQREIIEEQLAKNSYECVICVETIMPKQETWSCTTCFHIFHLSCILDWAEHEAALHLENNQSSHAPDPDFSGINLTTLLLGMRASQTSTRQHQQQSQSKKKDEQEQNITHFRCPFCNSNVEIVSLSNLRYMCYCGKVESPVYSQSEIPHSCGNVCDKPLNKYSQTPLQLLCPHRCQSLCHPGPCAPCSSLFQPAHPCHCGRERAIIACRLITSGENWCCGRVCGKRLTCGQHNCSLKCHKGECPECEHREIGVCFCGKERRGFKSPKTDSSNKRDIQQDDFDSEKKENEEINIETEEKEGFPCGTINRLLDQRKTLKFSDHNEKFLHELNNYIPDNQREIQNQQNKISDMCIIVNENQEIAPQLPQSISFCCGQQCQKVLSCGNHICQYTCHSGECHPCPTDSNAQQLQCGCGRALIKRDIEQKSERSTEMEVKYPYFSSSSSQSLIELPSRHSCLDPFTSCGNICQRTISICNHKCQRLCHQTIPYQKQDNDYITNETKSIIKQEKEKESSSSQQQQSSSIVECSPCNEWILVSCRCRKEKKAIRCSSLGKGLEEVKKDCEINNILIPQDIILLLQSAEIRKQKEKNKIIFTQEDNKDEKEEHLDDIFEFSSEKQQKKPINEISEELILPLYTFSPQEINEFAEIEMKKKKKKKKAGKKEKDEQQQQIDTEEEKEIIDLSKYDSFSIPENFIFRIPQDSQSQSKSISPSQSTSPPPQQEQSNKKQKDSKRKTSSFTDVSRYFTIIPTFMCRLTCDRKLSCNVHRCQNRCCPVKGNDSNAIFQQTHKCLQLCNKKLPCGHRCELLCHIGNCPRCTNTQLTEWSCTCGDTKVLPPIICGQTQIPRCLNTCVLNRRSCGHGGGGIDGMRRCPPCQHRITSFCAGGHVQLNNVPCSLARIGISCGQVCMKPLRCNIHFCKKVCHSGSCETYDDEKDMKQIQTKNNIKEKEKQIGNDKYIKDSSQTTSSSTSSSSTIKPQPCHSICQLPLPFCGHPCPNPCHCSSPCDLSTCEFVLPIIRCKCGNREESNFHLCMTCISELVEEEKGEIKEEEKKDNNSQLIKDKDDNSQLIKDQDDNSQLIKDKDDNSQLIDVNDNNSKQIDDEDGAYTQKSKLEINWKNNDNIYKIKNEHSYKRFLRCNDECTRVQRIITIAQAMKVVAHIPQPLPPSTYFPEEEEASVKRRLITMNSLQPLQQQQQEQQTTSKLFQFETLVPPAADDALKVYTKDTVKLTRTNIDLFRSFEAALALLARAGHQLQAQSQSHSNTQQASQQPTTFRGFLLTQPLPSHLGSTRLALTEALSIIATEGRNFLSNLYQHQPQNHLSHINQFQVLSPISLLSPHLTRERRVGLSEVAAQFGIYCEKPLLKGEGSTREAQITLSLEPFVSDEEKESDSSFNAVDRSGNRKQNIKQSNPPSSSKQTALSNINAIRTAPTPRIPMRLLSSAWTVAIIPQNIPIESMDLDAAV
ncbi:MAG: putative NF-X1-type zinc finger protein, partial [Streblomastix strix]